MTGAARPTGAGRAVAGVVAGLALAAVMLAFLPKLAGRLTAPLGDGAAGEGAFTLLVFAPLMLAGIVGGAVTSIRVWAPGRGAGPGAMLGSVGLLIAVALAGIAGTLRSGPPAASGLILAGVGVVFVQVLAEEVYFRGWLQPLLARAVGIRAAVVTIAVAFALLHLLAGGVGAVALVNLALGGVLFGLLAARGGGVAGAVAAHGCWNAGEQLVFGLDPNPGVGGFGALMNLDLVGAARWGGSPEGLNGSWAMAFALAAVLMLSRSSLPTPVPRPLAPARS